MRSLCFAVILLASACGGPAPYCGDGLIDPGEICDDGNEASGDGCSATCATEPNCGNGTLDTDEQCDDGNAVAGDGCSAGCTTEPCGNNIMDIGEQCDDGNFTPSDGCSPICEIEQQYTIAANWTIRNIMGTTQPCPATYDTAAVYSQALDSTGANVGQPIIDLFTCSSGSGTIAPIYEGRYKVWLAITNTNGTMTYATSVVTIVDLQMNLNYATQILTDGGYFAFAWLLRGATSNNSLTCAQVPNIDGIELLATISGTSTASSDIFNCADGSGVTAGLKAESYVVSVSALDTSQQAIGTAPAVTRVIQAPNVVTDLGTITIPITGL